MSIRAWVCGLVGVGVLGLSLQAQEAPDVVAELKTVQAQLAAVIQANTEQNKLIRDQSQQIAALQKAPQPSASDREKQLGDLIAKNLLAMASACQAQKAKPATFLGSLDGKAFSMSGCVAK